MNVVLLECPTCGIPAAVEIPGELVVFCDASGIVTCPTCSQQFGVSITDGILKIYSLSIDDIREHITSIIDWCEQTKRELLRQSESEQVPATDLHSLPPIESIDGDEEEKYQADFDCPQCGEKYALIGDEPPLERLNMNHTISCRKCHQPMPRLWRRSGTSNLFIPALGTSASDEQRAMSLISPFEEAVFDGMLVGTNAWAAIEGL